ncbi:MAG: hypothetical protein V3U92_19775 [Cellulophaga sp.]
MKQKFRLNIGLRADNIQKLDTINKIIEEFRGQGYKLTLRQLYYQLVSRDLIENKDSEYKKLGKLLVKGRMAGVVDWDAIEDRLRKPYLPYWASDVPDAINDILRSYRLDRMENQDVYIELWVEKDALSGVLKKITSKYHINLMVNRGYSSCSAMYDAYNRLEEQESDDKKTVILYLGDHDPSGLDMIRDIETRLEEFGVNPVVEHIGITRSQIDKFNPPPNPAKITDPRAKWYIQEHGNVSWEVDALNPETLNKLVSKHIEDRIDMDKFNEMLEREEGDKETLRNFQDKVGEDDDGY